jgi:PAS domain S-box-containing protein
MYGYTAQEAIGQPIAMLIPLERDDEEDAIFRRVLAGERVDHFETVRVHKDGRKLDMSLSVSAIHDLSGRLIGASSIARDVTDARSIVRAQDQVIKRLLLAAEFRDERDRPAHRSDVGTVRPNRPGHGLGLGGRRWTGGRGHDARRRQDRDPGFDPAQARIVDRGRKSAP